MVPVGADARGLNWTSRLSTDPAGGPTGWRDGHLIPAAIGLQSKTMIMLSTACAHGEAQSLADGWCWCALCAAPLNALTGLLWGALQPCWWRAPRQASRLEHGRSRGRHMGAVA